MEDGKKKSLMFVIMVVCFLAASVFVFLNLNGRTTNYMPKGSQVWIKCNNSECNHAYQIDGNKYYKYIEDHTVGPFAVPAIECPECGQNTCYKANKCKKCETIFFDNYTGGFEDRCPKCNYSELEEKRKNSK